LSESFNSELNYITLQDAAPVVLTPHALYDDDRVGHAVIVPGVVNKRDSALTVSAAPGLSEEMIKLKKIFHETGYTSEPIIAARLRDVTIDLWLGICITTDGQLIDETATVGYQIDPSYSSPILTQNADTFAVFEEPILHCFHRAIGAYGHFIFDGLIPINQLHDAIRNGFRVLVPSYVPEWAVKILLEIGIPEASIYRPQASAMRFKDVVIPSSIQSLSTFYPNANLCNEAPRVCRRLIRSNYAAIGMKSIVA